MKVTPLMFGNPSGSLLGITASHNRYGSYLRGRTKPVNPQSIRQDAARNKLTYLTSLWNSAAMDTYRAGWNLYAANLPATPGSTSPTGFNFFISSNAVRMWAYGTAQLAPPNLFTLPTIDTKAAATVSEATQLISVTFDPTNAAFNEIHGCMVVSMGMPKMNTGEFFNGPYRQAGLVDGATVTPPTSPQTIAVPWPVAEGQRIWTNFRILRADGRLSNPFRSYCVVGT